MEIIIMVLELIFMFNNVVIFNGNDFGFDLYLEYDYDFEDFYVFLLEELVLVFIVYGLILVLGIIGNILVIVFVIWFWKLYSVINVFLFSLVFVDLFLVVVCILVKVK